MEVPATRPEVTTTGIYGEELSAVRQRLQSYDLYWCGDLTSRTQVLIVGLTVCAASRKLSVARMRGLPCVSIEWVTNGACAVESTDDFDISHELAGKEVCTTSLHNLERGRVQAVCGARRAAYNALLTRHCGLLVASAAALGLTPSSSSSTTSNDKVRFARKYGIPIIAIEEFMSRYATERVFHHLPPKGAGPERVVSGASSLKALSGPISTSSTKTNTDVSSEPKPKTDCTLTVASAGSLSSSNTNEVLACGSTRPSVLPVRCAIPTSRSTVASRGCSIASVRGPRDTEGIWSGCDSIMPSAVQPSLSSSQLMSTVSITAYASPPGLSRRSLADEFSDVTAYCSPPHRLTTQRYDLLSGMGVTVSPQLTPFTTHVLVLGEDVEECLYPRPGLQMVSWQWVSQCQLEQRRLSCLGFRVECTFSPVVTFTGLGPVDRHALISALQRSGLPGKVQEALVLGGSGGERSGTASSLPQVLESNSRLPLNTTHLVAPRGQLLSSQKVAMLAQHHYQHSSRARPPSSAPLPWSPTCRLVEVDWVYRSIQQAKWLDADLFTLPVPTLEAFALTATTRTSAACTALSRSSRTSQERLSVKLRISQPFSASTTATNLARQTSVLRQPSSSLCRSPDSQGVTECTLEGGLEKPAFVEKVVKEREEEEEAASSQQHKTAIGHTNETASPSSSPLCGRDDDDEEAGGEPPLAAAAGRPALQAIPSLPPPLSTVLSHPARSPSSLTGKQDGGTTIEKDEFAATVHHHADPAVPPCTYPTTQCSPGFENLLGELEAAPPGTLFGVSAIHGSLYPHIAARTAANASAISVPPAGGRGDQVQRIGSNSATPPSTDADVCVERRAFLRRTSVQPHMIQQQQQLLCRTMSDESQVVVYHMGLYEDGGIAAVPPTSSHGDRYAISESGEDKTAVEAAVSPASGVAGAIACVYPRSTFTSAVFLATKEVRMNHFECDAFSGDFQHIRRTSKPEECTHFITAKPSKTEQFLCCLAAGRWILTPAYVAACVQAGYLVSEESFEWSAEVAASLGCRSSVASLARGCRVQREASQLPFTSWRVRVCCTNSARAASFLRVLRNGGCTSLEAATAAEVMAASRERGSAPPLSTELVLADDAVFSEDELEDYASRPAFTTCPIMRLEYLVQFLCAPDTPRSEMDLLQCLRPRKRSRAETAAAE